MRLRVKIRDFMRYWDHAIPLHIHGITRVTFIASVIRGKVEFLGANGIKILESASNLNMAPGSIAIRRHWSHWIMSHLALGAEIQMPAVALYLIHMLFFHWSMIDVSNQNVSVVLSLCLLLNRWFFSSLSTCLHALNHLVRHIGLPILLDAVKL